MLPRAILLHKLFRYAVSGPWLALAIGMGVLLALATLPGSWGTVYGQTVPDGGGDEADSGNTNDDDDSSDDGECPSGADCGGVGNGDGSSWTSENGEVQVQHTGGEPVLVTFMDVDPGDSVTLPPAGLQPLVLAELQLQPDGTPNFVNLILHYTDEQLAGISEGSLRMFYYDPDLNMWVELPVVIDPIANTVTVSNVDVSAFADDPHFVGLFVQG